MICKRCGSEIPDRSVYCVVCGSKIEDQSVTGQQWDSPAGAAVNRQGKHRGSLHIVVGVLFTAVILLAFIIAGLNEAPGSVNTVLNTVTFGVPSESPSDNDADLPRYILSTPIEESVKAICSLAVPRIEMMAVLSEIQIDEYETTMELPGGPCVGKYLVIHNNSDVVMDVKGTFVFFDGSGNERDSTEYMEYGIAPHDVGVVLGQSADTDIRTITYRLSSSVSDYEPVSENVRMKVADRGEKGIRVTVQNDSGLDIEDFRIRVLWFQGDDLETVAYRWLEQDDHHFYTGKEKTVDFKRKWGKESYLVILQGRVRR